MDEFTIIGITLPQADVAGDAERIVALLESGAVDRFHLRKPDADESVLRRLLTAIPQEYHARLSLHDAPWLLAEFPQVGFHLNRRHPAGISAGTLSRSCHSAGEVMKADSGLDYVTLSPVFDSISKEGYVGRSFTGEAQAVATRRVIALGGVVPGRFAALRKRGFSGAAMLGWLWTEGPVENIIEEINRNKR